MGELHLPNNIKVHFAACEVGNEYLAVKYLGVKYTLYTLYPFLCRKVFGKNIAPILPLDEQKSNPYYEIPQYIIRNSIHTIQDSGLFSLMFGAMKGRSDEKLVNTWYDALVEFTLANSAGATCVEVDCQKLLGVNKAWEFRERLRKDIPNRIINVFHVEDGLKGLDRLIEYSDYIAISVPELRALGKAKETTRIARYIKNKKPSIDIHLLGCTTLELIEANRYCTSCDSSSWTSTKRYGFPKHTNDGIIKEKVMRMVKSEEYAHLRHYNNDRNACTLILTIEMLKAKYQNSAGNQDYYKELSK